MGRILVALVGALALLPLAPAQGASLPSVSVLSNRSDLISGSTALVAVNVAPKTRLAKLRVGLVWTVRRKVGGRTRTLQRRRDVTPYFKLRPDGKFEGVVRRLPPGRVFIRATAGKRRGPATPIVNHRNGGPVTSGPQLQPWKCQKAAIDKQCNQVPRFTYVYKARNKPGWLPYNVDNPPKDAVIATTDEGVRVPFVVRVETGYQDRDQFKIAVLYQPGKPWAPWAPQEQFNHKAVMMHGHGCGVDYEPAGAPAVYGPSAVGLPVVDDVVKAGSSDPGGEALGRGFAVMSTALNDNSHNCNIAVQAEAMIMLKEHLIEAYGPLRYTIGSGCSGGSLVQQQVANAYPGLYQGLTPQCSYPDTFSPGAQFADYHLLRLYFEDAGKWGPGVAWSPSQFASVEGHVSHANAITADEGLFKSAINPTHACGGLTDAERYDPAKNPTGVRCSILDMMINVLGPRPPDVWTPLEKRLGRGLTGVPFGNVGIQYGLKSLSRGEITPAQFVDVNAKIGGLDLDINQVPERLAGDDFALANAYRSGALNQANHLDKVAIINLSGPDPGIAHDFSHALWMPARLEREHGHRRNYVMWFGQQPVLGDVDYARLSIIAMDRWLAAVEKDTSSKALSQKIIDNKPKDLVDKCAAIQGLELIDLPGVGKVCELDAVRLKLGTPRTVSGQDFTSDANKCQLKPLRREDYQLPFTADQWATLQRTFPTGVCDWSKPGVGQQSTIAWQTYQRGDGKVIYGGRALPSPPARSGSAWAGPVFRPFKGS